MITLIFEYVDRSCMQVAENKLWVWGNLIGKQ